MTNRKMFVNLSVEDLDRSVAFFRDLGFEFDERFTDDTATCMLVGEDAYVMLVVADRFRTFTTKQPADARRDAEALVAFAVESRAEVDELADKALAAGGSPATDPQDHGFMYERAFLDPDGHQWSAFWMDPAAVEQGPETHAAAQGS